MAWLNDVEGGRWVDDPVPTPYQRLTGNDPSIAWVNSLIQDPYGWNPGSDVAAPGVENPGQDANVALMGAFSHQGTAPNMAIEQALRSIATAAGKPDFDWTTAKAKAAQQHYQQYGSFYTAGGNGNDTSWPGLVALIAQNAGDPAITQVWQQNAPTIQQSLQDAQTQYSTAEEQRDSARHKMTFAAMAAPLAAWAAAPAAAGTAGSAAAAPAAGLSEALGSGLSVGATGAEGLSAAAGGASGISGAGAAGTALAPGFFAAETLAPVLGGATAAASQGLADAGGAATTAAKSTALQRILNGGGTQADWLELGGQALPSILSAWGSNQQAGALKDLAGQYMAMGAPYRQQLADITADPSKYFESAPARESLEQVLRRLSVNGNPAGSPYSQALAVGALNEQYGKERDRLAGYGGLTQFNAAAPGTSVAGINANQSTLADIGYGIGRVMNPQPTLAGLLKDLKLSY